VVGELAASLENESAPWAVPVAAGLNVTVNEAVSPSASVAGREIPESENSVLSTLAAAIVTEDPLALKVPFSVLLAPTTTFPKPRVAGSAESCPADVPVPESATLSVGLFAFEVTASVPLAEPALDGENVTEKVTLWLGFRLIGRFRPLVENAALLLVTAETVTAESPVFVSVSLRLALFPLCTLPNGKLGEDALRVDFPWGLDPPEGDPPHPVSATVPATARVARSK
jgi:hypothetical protein